MTDQAPAGGTESLARAIGVDLLSELALDLRSAWNHAADTVWQQLEPELWGSTRNPWAVLQTVSREKLRRAFADDAFFKRVSGLVEARRAEAASSKWFARAHPDATLNGVAYFSMEFMLSEALPIYSGGLGNVAGDQLKAASDLGVPVIGVGLLYQQGYFRQVIDENGAQEAILPYNDPGQLPISPVRQADGEWLRLKLDLPGYLIWLRAWQARVGNRMLYLLDSNDLANFPPYRGITGELYGGGPYMRLLQEVVLGIGGWRLLTALGIAPDVCHLNEGHAAFAVLERARTLMKASNQPFETALAATRAGNLFTTHTAVAAAFDRFAPALIARCLGGYAQEELGIALEDLLALGRSNPRDMNEDFNMAYLALRGSAGVNGVSRLHGEVSRQLFAPLFPRWPLAEIPIGHVTNGVHMPTWDSAAADDLWTRATGKSRWQASVDTLEDDIRKLGDTHLWEFRAAARAGLVAQVRERLAAQLTAAGGTADAIEQARRIFDPNTLTLGFARRFATYKRPNLLLRDPQRLTRLLCDRDRPVQLILAGKAHPADTAGQALIHEWMEFIRQPDIGPHVVFLSDYDMHLTQELVHGVDVWLNTPRRPWEASGTSGMKVLVNGGLNLSELDGWWAEAYAPEAGWALGDGLDHGGDPTWDAVEAESLYDILERQVVPDFYARDDDGIPAAWVGRIRESMARLTPRFSTNRSLRQYAEDHYLPAAAAYRARVADDCAVARGVVARTRTLERAWPALRIGEPDIETNDEYHAFKVQVFLGGLNPDMISVELYANAVADQLPAIQPMSRLGSPVVDGTYIYAVSVSATRPVSDYTVRLVPGRSAAIRPLESRQIRWQR
jgi:glycogen phosphorylase